MPDHFTLKLIHQACALLSITGFALRAGLMLADSQLLWRRWMRTWPHLIDTLLLVSGVWMVIRLQLPLSATPWLIAKLAALLLYIVLGFVALRLGRSKQIRILALIGALACFVYIALVAVKRSPLPL